MFIVVSFEFYSKNKKREKVQTERAQQLIDFARALACGKYFLIFFFTVKFSLLDYVWITLRSH